MITPDPRVIFLAIFLVLSIQNLASAAVIRARQGDVSPADGTDGATYTQHPAHQTRPALSDDMRPNSTASRMGMSPGESERPHRGHKNRTSSASWTRPAPSEQTGDVDSGLSKVRGLQGTKSPKRSRRHFARNRRSFRDAIRLDSKIARLVLQGRDEHKSSSAVVQVPKSDERGHYVVSGKPSKDRASSIFPRYNRKNLPVNKRDGDSNSADGDSSEAAGMTGTVAIMSHVDNSTTGRRLASLYMDESGDGPYILNASEKNATQLQLIPSSAVFTPPSTTPSDGGGDNSDSSSGNTDASSPEAQVVLRAKINQEMYCATYDPNPPRPEPLSMELCMKQPSSEHRSQTFSYNRESGVIRPMWFAASGDAQEQSEGAGQDGASSSASESTTPSASALAPVSSASIVSREASSPGPQNVTLVFVPASDASSMIDSDTDATETPIVMTTTVTVTASAQSSAVASSKAFNVNGADSMSASLTSSAPASSMTAMAATSDSALASSTASSVDSTPTSSTLNVQVVGDESSTESVASSTTITIPASSLQAMATATPSSSVFSARNAASSAIPSDSTASSLVVADASSDPSSSSSSATGTVSFAAAEVSSTITSSAEATPSASLDADAIASQVASSASAQSSSYSSSSMVAVGVRRRNAAPAQMTAIDTHPYKWTFKAEDR